MPKSSTARGTLHDVFEGYRQRLLKFIRSRVNLVEDAEDILQDVFYQFARADSLVNPVENAAAWLYRATRNKIIDHYRKKKDESLPVSYQEDEDEYVFDEIADVLYGEKSSPETEYLRLLIAEEIQTALADLPPEQREAFELSELNDMPVKEIAEKTGVPVSTALSRKHYAVKFLRRRLTELYNDVIGQGYPAPWN